MEGGRQFRLPVDLAVPESAGAACLPCRRLVLPFALFLSPIPPTPFPAGRGRILVFLCKGLRPLHPPGLNSGGTGAGGEPRARWGAAIPVACQPCSSGIRRGGLPSLSPARPVFSFISFPYPPDPLPPWGRGRLLVHFAGGTAPGTPAAGAYGSAQGGKESVAYRLARAVRVQPRGCKGRSPLHEIPLVSPSPEGKGQGDGGKTPFGFCRGLSPGGADSTLDISFLSALAGFTQFKSTSSQYKFEKSSGGSGGLFQESPSVSPASLQRLQRFSFSGRWCRLWYRPA